jgi:hypothetical protein
MGRRWSAVAVFIVVGVLTLSAQEERPDTTEPAGHVPAVSRLPVRVPPLLSDTLSSSVPAKSPGTAVLLSAILPGAGQFYNESYWKVPLIAGLEIYFVSEWLSNNRSYKDYRDQYAADLLVHPGGNANLLALREFYRDQRDSFTWYFLILYVVNIADAYVDASLFNFDVSGNLAQSAFPSARLTVRMRF